MIRSTPLLEHSIWQCIGWLLSSHVALKWDSQSRRPATLRCWRAGPFNEDVNFMQERCHVVSESSTAYDWYTEWCTGWGALTLDYKDDRHQVTCHVACLFLVTTKNESRTLRCWTLDAPMITSTLVWSRPVILFSERNTMFVGYFDPLNICLRYKNTWFSGWRNQCFCVQN